MCTVLFTGLFPELQKVQKVGLFPELQKVQKVCRFALGFENKS